ncbi:MAG: ribonuclease III [Clostridiales Family XIII bacterium]|jgi:ribonuclease-3|nr:ribonuclease III [Clostridiales Family XIII bacterium]
MNDKALSEKIGYGFRDARLLRMALSHSSYVNEAGLTRFQSNERLEFLGDAMLESIISLELYSRLPYVGEGDLTKLRAYIVCEGSLFRCATAFSLGSFLNLGKGEERNGGRNRPSVVADAMEALIGAIFLDGGRDAAEGFVMRALAPVIEEAMTGVEDGDYKSRLQETLQTDGAVRLCYRMERAEGPDHDKLFHVSVLMDDSPIGSGMGKSKKQAEQNAARNALEKSSCTLNA